MNLQLTENQQLSLEYSIAGLSLIFDLSKIQEGLHFCLKTTQDLAKDVTTTIGTNSLFAEYLEFFNEVPFSATSLSGDRINGVCQIKIIEKSRTQLKLLTIVKDVTEDIQELSENKLMPIT